jgi:hypothetical protein
MSPNHPKQKFGLPPLWAMKGHAPAHIGGLRMCARFRYVTEEDAKFRVTRGDSDLDARFEDRVPPLAAKVANAVGTVGTASRKHRSRLRGTGDWTTIG